MWQSSRLYPLLPAWFLVLLLEAMAGPTCLNAQTRYSVVQNENFRRDPSPSAVELGRVVSGAEFEGIGEDGNWVQIRLEGWIWSASVQNTNRDGFDLRVTEEGGENVRAAPNGTIVARAALGALLDEVGRQGNWIRVQRVGWVWSRALSRVQTNDPTGSNTQPSTPADATLDRAVTARQAQVFGIPEGEERGVLEPETPVRILARSGEWVRVQTEGWMRESDLRAAASGVLEGVTGAEVRASPQEYVGRLLQWTLQYLAIQEADELRGEIPVGQQYMLARGPLPEAGFVYVVIPPDDLEEVERLAPLAEIVIIGRVRAASSQYLGNPIIDLVDLAVREQ
ncbi:MAG: SH3 domain-containing protein [Myxococcota bacterium]|nr:SH3 domain-containing protein [Myxococcota bacterium]